MFVSCLQKVAFKLQKSVNSKTDLKIFVNVKMNLQILQNYEQNLQKFVNAKNF